MADNQSTSEAEKREAMIKEAFANADAAMEIVTKAIEEMTEAEKKAAEAEKAGQDDAELFRDFTEKAKKAMELAVDARKRAIEVSVAVSGTSQGSQRSTAYSGCARTDFNQFSLKKNWKKKTPSESARSKGEKTGSSGPASTSQSGKEKGSGNEVAGVTKAADEVPKPVVSILKSHVRNEGRSFPETAKRLADAAAIAEQALLPPKRVKFGSSTAPSTSSAAKSDESREAGTGSEGCARTRPRIRATTGASTKAIKPKESSSSSSHK